MQRKFGDRLPSPRHDYNRSPSPFRAPSPGMWAPVSPPPTYPQFYSQSQQYQHQQEYIPPAPPEPTSSVPAGASYYDPYPLDPPQYFYATCELELRPCFDAEIVYPPGTFPESQKSQLATFQTQTSNYSNSSNIQQQHHQYFQTQAAEYVEDFERLEEFQAELEHLHDERDRMQIKTFTNWINSYLSKYDPSIQISSLFEDLRDGVQLLTLLSIIGGRKLPVEKGRRRHHFICNYNTALQFLQDRRIKLVNINACDLVDGRPCVVLGLLWTIILHFQIVDHSAQTQSTQQDTSSNRDRGARQALLEWVKGLFAQNGIPYQVSDFDKSWRDGMAFGYLVNCLKPGLLDIESLHWGSSNQVRLSKTFQVAAECLEISPILDPVDVDVNRPDERSVMTYVAQFLDRYSSQKEIPEPQSQPQPSPQPQPEPMPELRPPTPPPPPPLPQPQQEEEPSPGPDMWLEEFKSELMKAQEWLKQSELLISTFPRLHTCLSEKRKAVVEFQPIMQSVLELMHALDRLGSQQQQQQKQCLESSLVSGEVIQLKNQFTSLQNLAREMNSALEDHYQQHESYWAKFQEVVELQRNLRLALELQPPDSEKLNLSDLEGNLERCEVLMKECIHLGEKVIETTLEEGHPAILEQCHQIQVEYEDLLSLLRKCKEKLESQDAMQSDYLRALQETEQWLLQMSQKLSSENPYSCRNLDEVKSKLKEHEIFMDSINSYQNMLDSLTNKGHTLQELKPEMRDSITAQLQNVNDEYASLLQNGNKFKDLLLASMGAFRDFENALANISERLNLMDREMETSPSDLDGIRNQLENEKTTFRVSVENWKNAWPSECRPPPLDQEKEVEGHLEDLLKRIEAEMAKLLSAQALQKARDEIAQWIKDTDGKLTDIEKRPVQLKAMPMENSEIGKIMDDIHSTKIKLANISPGDDIDILKLEEHADAVSKLRSQLYGTMSGFQDLLKKGDLWLADITSKMNSPQTSNDPYELGIIREELNDISSFITNDLKGGFNAIKDILPPEDFNEIGNHIQEMENQIEKMKNLGDAQLQALEASKSTLNSFLGELNSFADEGKCMRETLMSPKIGWRVSPAEDALSRTNSALKQLEQGNSNMKFKFESIQIKLKPSHAVEKAKENFKSVFSEREKLCDDLKKQRDSLKDGVNLRKTFQGEIETLSDFINRATPQTQLQHIPLECSRVGGIQNALARILEEGQNLGKNLLQKFKGEAGVLGNDCNEMQGAELKHQVSEVELRPIIDQIHNLLSSLTPALNSRKNFEEGCTKIAFQIFKVEESIPRSDPGNAKGHLDKCRGLIAECEVLQGEIKILIDGTSDMVPTLSKEDQQIVQDKLNGLTNDLLRVQGELGKVMKLFEDNIKTAELVGSIVGETQKFLGALKDKLVTLKNPPGFRLGDTENLLSEYERLLADLKAYRQRLADSPFSNDKDLQALMAEKDTLAAQIEAEIERLKRILRFQQQFVQLITDIMGFIVKYTDVVKEIENSGGDIHDKIGRYQEVIVKIGDCEGLLKAAVEQSELIFKEEGVPEEDIKAIAEQLESLTFQHGGLMKTVKDKLEEHMATAKRYEAYEKELVPLISWLENKENECLNTNPPLQRPISSVETNLKDHEKLQNEMNDRISKVDDICQALKHEDSGLPKNLKENVRKGHLLLERLREKLERRKEYLCEQLKLREVLEGGCKPIKTWISEGNAKLHELDGGINFDAIEGLLEVHNSWFGVESKVSQDKMKDVKKTGDEILPGLIESEKNGLKKELVDLNDGIQNTLNAAKTSKTKLEEARSLYKTYQDLANYMILCISRADDVKEEPMTSLHAVKRNMTAIQSEIGKLESESPQLSSLVEWAKSAEKLASKESRDKLENRIKEINSKWRDTLNRLNSRNKDLTKLETLWNKCNDLCDNFEKELASIEQRFSQVDPFLRSGEQLEDTKIALNEILKRAKVLEGSTTELMECFRTVKEFPNVSVGILESRVDQLLNLFASVLKTLEDKLKLIAIQEEYLESANKKVDELQNFLARVEEEIQNLDPFEKDFPKLDLKVTEVERKVKGGLSDITTFHSEVKEKFSDWKQILPSSLARLISNLELRVDEIQVYLDEKKKAIKKGRALISEFERDVENLKSWKSGAETQLEGNNVNEPVQLQKVIQNLVAELPGAVYQMERAVTTGTTIADKCLSPTERERYKAIAEDIEDLILKFKQFLEERKLKIDECVEFWKRFMDMYNQVMSWVSEQNEMIKEPLRLSSLDEAHQKLNTYAESVKSLKGVSKILSDMRREALGLAEMTCASLINEKLDEAEQAKTDVGGQILERSSLLQETAEEWEQFEKKLKEVRSWLKKAKQLLESTKPAKIKSTREKLLAGIGVQRTKISMALEKLQVHFRMGMAGDPNLEKEEREIDKELEMFGNEVKALDVSTTDTSSS